MSNKRFDPANLEKLNNPERLAEMPVSFMSTVAGLDDPRVIVDIGAGTGLFSRALADYHRCSTVYAFDISPVMVDWMKAHVAPLYPTVIPMLMDDGRVPLADGVADFVLMVNLHHEIDDSLRTVREVYRLLKPGAGLAVSDWRKEDTKKGPPVSIRVDAADVEAELRHCGFGAIRIFTGFRYNYLVVATK